MRLFYNEKPVYRSAHGFEQIRGFIAYAIYGRLYETDMVCNNRSLLCEKIGDCPVGWVPISLQYDKGEK